MSHLSSNEKESEANYTAVEINGQPKQSSSSSSPIYAVVNTCQRQWRENGLIKLISIAVGIFLSYFVVGILQEKIVRVPYIGSDKKEEKFKHVTTLVGVNFIFSFIFMKVLDVLKPEEEKDKTKLWYYALASAANTSAMISSYSALRWVTYPMQVIFKSAKPLSVMMSGLLICKRYAIQRYFFVLIIVTGVVFFKYFEEKPEKKAKDGQPIANEKTTKEESDIDYQMLGTALLLLSLFFDGLLGAVQDKVREKFAPSSRKFMLGMSAFGSLITSVVIIVTGEIVHVYEFIGRHPDILWHIAVYAICSVVGQLFIFAMVANFGSLACSVTTTVRKFFSVLFSIIFFGNPSTPLQWVGAIFVFSGLFADAFFGKKHSKPSQQQNETELMEHTTDKLMPNSEEKPTTAKNNSTQQNAQEIV
ncbi:solute carrier family 35 member B1-like [Contarinia nasturtii]|uniref:solute carrier family 35 member B1-like n=1 Tax=Contarinia nasturtii TaxID=265458 RepID=UPI0012D4BEC1|nr:solute carrier family 35 member B1-like [Contarinia nasturtii]XP_031636442.1 solute carrier family 35 member B1-like [Contarinia nasturtii]XP_031636444.1 solute carrier family 35 member B1-like [Contarinia nasturtii]